MRNDKSLAQYALYVAIIADGFAAIPTFASATFRPEDDRPLPWGMFGLAYALAIFAAPEHTVANYALPIYMLLASGFIVWQLAKFRLRERIPVNQWI